MRENFRAKTKYNDFVGTVAAEGGNNQSFAKLLKDRRLLHDGEQIVGFEIVFDDNPGDPMPDPGIIAYVAQIQGDSLERNDEGVIKLRSIEVFDLPIADFFKFFKRFNMFMSKERFALNGAEFIASE